MSVAAANQNQVFDDGRAIRIHRHIDSMQPRISMRSKSSKGLAQCYFM